MSASSQESELSGDAAERDDAAEAASRFVVGIDLGTTNCAVAFVDTTQLDWRIETFSIAQWVDLGQLESRETLPSFHYQYTTPEATGAEAHLPWARSDDQLQDCVGVYARDAGQRHPGRRIASAKSWLSHDGVDRSADFLPWHGDADVARMSPVDASAKYLAHIRAAWDYTHPRDPLRDQDVVITLPASFDEVARELTIQAAKQAGLRRVFLIEEPQAAFYAWIDRHRNDWANLVEPGQLILVCDIGGGTTDLTLIRVRPAGDHGEQVQFHRVAVGKHLILGGDNMDLAIAKLAERKLVAEQTVTELSPDQWDRLIGAARAVKETMLADQRPLSYTLNLPSGGSRIVGGSLQVELTQTEIDSEILAGFFPIESLTARPDRGQSGFQEFGLPYAADPAVTRHLAEFLREHRRSGLDVDDDQSADRPDLVLFNGGVMGAASIRDRIIESLCQWFAVDGEEWRPQVLASTRLDLAVAQGAAYYAMVRRGEGVRIAANLARSYYMQVNDQPPTALCLITGDAEAGQRFRADDHPLKLQIGAPVQFPLWVSSTRLADHAGELVPIDRAEMSPLPPICTALVRGRRRVEDDLSVFVESELSEIGTVGMYCVDADSGKRWKLEFDIRSTLETDRDAHLGGGEAVGIVDAETISDCEAIVASAFADTATIAPSQLVKRLQSITETSRHRWPPSLLRELWQFLIDHEAGRRQSAQHEARWLNLVGFSLRPGYGVAVDDWRVQQTWRSLHGKLAFPATQSRTESLVLWRRIAGGMTSGQQQQLAAPMIGLLQGKSGRQEPQQAAESWRLVGALERLNVRDKIELGESALRETLRKKSEKLRPALLWALGRIGSRQPVYGPLNATVPVGTAETWLKQLIQQDLDEPLAPLAVAQLGRKTGDRYRDLPESLRQRAAEWLQDRKASPHLIDLLVVGGQLDQAEEAAVFGDTLPLGIRLVR